MPSTAKKVSPLPSAVMDKRITGSIFVTATLANPQGGVDNGNHPRVDQATGLGFITPAGIKRKIRDVIGLMGHPIFIARKAVLATLTKEAIAGVGIAYKGNVGDEEGAKGTLDAKDKDAVLAYLCKQWWDVRAFGGVICKPVNEGITGPVQFGFGRSIDPVEVIEIATTRVAVTKEADAHKERTIGRIAVISFGLYRMDFSINPFNAALTGFTWGDLQMLLDAMQGMFDQSNATTRFGLITEKIVLFHHNSQYGNAPDHKLQRRVKAVRVNPKGLPDDELPAPKGVDDYAITVDADDLPSGIDVEVID